ncbi:MAG: 23S rRNA (guanosine(2251)-2'-O)-methyltransferase RlmB, partial [Oscillospiraceae bacterium]|nr:23S rRNA (guanosine(2251)-2'-O)-methyltransferase RlmB [Oscillospiraceae bacterium]
DKIIGRNPVLEAIRSGRSIDKILIKKGRYEGSIVPIIRKAKDAKIPIQEVDSAKLDAVAEGENHQGIIAYVSAYEYVSVEDILTRARERNEPPFVIICDKITDPHNLGAILRTANCVGAHGVIIPKRGSAGLNSVVAKTSAGAVEYTPVAKVTNIAGTIEALKKNGMWIAGADMDGEEMYNLDLRGALGLVIGNEGEGISRLVKESCDFLAKIPMNGEINSLNASVAAGILMYEALRQRRN